MVGTLVLTFCDVEMGKIVTALLSKQTLNMAEMRAQVRNLEPSRTKETRPLQKWHWDWEHQVDWEHQGDGVPNAREPLQHGQLLGQMHPLKRVWAQT